MRIAVIGTGYVGLVAGTCFADAGNHVVCVDSNPSKIQGLKNGIIPIFEPGLEALVQHNFEAGRLVFSTRIEDATEQAEVIFLAVGTPSLPSGSPDLSYLKAAVEGLARNLKKYTIIVNKSTVPIGSHEVVAQWMSQCTQVPFDVVSNPEFLKEGSAVDDFLKPDRVIIGTVKKSVYEKMLELYSPFVRQGNPILWMDPVSAEMTKYACNSFLATRISFMNELSVLCERVGADIEMVRHGMSGDERIGKHFLYAGAGYGGSCFPKDVRALISTGLQNQVELGIIRAAEIANERQKELLPQKVKAYFGGNLQGKTFILWGLAFKPNTDDMREAPSLVVVQKLLEAGAQVRVFDPVATKNARAILKDQVVYLDDAYKGCVGADALMIVTEWNEFKNPDFDQIINALKEPVIFDGRNLFSPQLMKDKGFKYFSIGRS